MEKEGFVLDKKDLKGFLKSLKKIGRLIAPVKRDVIRFEEIKEVSDIFLQGISWFSPKKIMFSQNQTWFKFKNNKIEIPKDNFKKTVLFGVRLCDSNALYRNDYLFLKDDTDYKTRRENTYLIALYCKNAVDEYCFCSSMELKDDYDLLLIDRKTRFHIKVGSEKGKYILRKLWIRRTSTCSG